MKKLILLLIIPIILGADFRVKDGTSYSDITIAGDQNEQGLLGAALAGAGFSGTTEEVLQYRYKNANATKVEETDQIVLRNFTARTRTEYDTFAEAKAAADLLADSACWDIISEERPIGSRRTPPPLYEVPCFDRQ